MHPIGRDDHALNATVRVRGHGFAGIVGLVNAIAESVSLPEVARRVKLHSMWPDSNGPTSFFHVLTKNDGLIPGPRRLYSDERNLCS